VVQISAEDSRAVRPMRNAAELNIRQSALALLVMTEMPDLNVVLLQIEEVVEVLLEEEEGLAQVPCVALIHVVQMPYVLLDLITLVNQGLFAPAQMVTKEMLL